MKRKLLSMLVLLMTAISVAWGQEESRLYLEVNSQDKTAVLRYGQVPASTPYYDGISYDWVGFDENIAKSSVTAITVDESCKNYEGTTLHHLFNGFSALTTINGLTNLYTASVIDMGEMFGDCGKLTSLDFSGWSTAKVENMSFMFSNCLSLASLDLSGWNTEKVQSMKNMFNGCLQLATLTFGEGWNTGSVTDMSGMFSHCWNLESLDLSSWNTASVTDMHEMFNGCPNLKNIYVGNGWSTDKVTEPESSDDMFASCDNLPNWDGTTDASKAKVGDGGYLTSSNLYLEVDPQNNTLATLRYGQVPHDTPYYVGGDDNVWSDDSAMSGVTTITVAESCKHFAGTTLSNLFSGFTELKTINDLKNLNTAKVTDMSYMFSNCSSLASLTFGEGWNTGSVTDMCGMFLGCSSLESLDVSGWNTAKVTDMSGMFYDCKNLATLTFGDNWSTAGVNGMVSMFRGCSSLASLDLSSWNTGSVTDMSLMFLGCSSLALLTFGEGWNTGSVTDMSCMFFACSQLENIYVGNGWSTENVTRSDDMFKGCEKLPNFNSAVVDKTHANTGAGGYLTMKLQAHQGAQGEFWATFYSAISNYQAPEGTQVFTVNLDGTSITMKEIGDGIVESGQGVVLKASTADGINLTPTDDEATGDFSDNSLQGTATSIQNPGNAYVLNYKPETGAGFYKLSSTGTIGANKAYLTYGSPAQEEPVNAPAFFSFDNTTGIVEMRNEGNEWNEGNGENGENAIWYDLNGRRLQGKPAQKGLYIVNGKKVIIK